MKVVNPMRCRGARERNIAAGAEKRTGPVEAQLEIHAQRPLGNRQGGTRMPTGPVNGREEEGGQKRGKYRNPAKTKTTRCR